MKLQSKILFPILTVLVLSFILISYTSVSVMQSSTKTIVESEMKNVADSVSHQISLTDDITDFVLNMMNQKNIALTQSLALLIAENPDNLKTEKMAQIAAMFEVDELHVTDEKGILTWGSLTDFFGFNFRDGDQTRPLLAILEDPSLVIAQEPQPRGANGDLFQYISVSRIDRPGIVQVGVSMATIDNIKLSMNIQKAIEDIKIGKEGGVFLLDSEKQIIAASSNTILGLDLAGLTWVDAMFRQNEGKLQIYFNEIAYDSFFRQAGQHMIVTYIPVSEIEGYAGIALRSIYLTGISTALIVAFITLMLLRWITRKVYWFESILDCIPFMVSVTDINRNLLFVNKPVEKYLNKKRTEVTGRQCSIMGRKICHTEGCGIDCLEKEKPIPAYSQNGVEYKVDVSYLMDERKRKVGHIELTQDLTEMVKLQKKLESALEGAKSASRAKSNFLANMSHEIRTPMNAIIGMVNIGKTAVGIERKDYSLTRIEDASKHLLGIINDILDVSKIESGKFELSPVEFNFEKMLKRIVSVISFRVDEKKQKFTVYIDREIPKYLIGDDQRLAQVITNLLGNAVKFTPEKGSIALHTYFLGETDGVCELKISIKDTGIGISPEHQEKLFHSFQQAESDTSRKFGGTGLGLAISKSIAEMMGGRIWIESELGKGATFAFTVKMRRDLIKQIPDRRKTDWKNIRVLTVDDDDYILQDFKGIIQKLGATCDIASNGMDALKLIEQNGRYDFYFIDWKMPEMDGIKLTEKVKSYARGSGDSFVIMISAAESIDVAWKAKSVGVDKFMQKPLFPSTIADVMREFTGAIEPQEHDDSNENISGLFRGRRILLAEDVEINREIVLAFLEPTEIGIDCAENGEEAVRMFSSAPDKYDMIFMDIQMPEMDGYRATRAIRSLEVSSAKTIPIIAMTANVFREDVEKCLEAGMDGHVGKPLDFDEVLEKLRDYLKKR